MPKQPQPFTAADPDAPGYDAMVAKQRVTNERRERELAEAEHLARISSAAGAAARINATGELGSAGLAAFSGAPEDLEAARFAKRFTGPVGEMLSVVTASSAFRADRARGMPLDEALIKHGGGYALGKVIGIGAGTASATLFGRRNPSMSLAVGTTMQQMGEKDGEYLATDIATAWKNLKSTARQFRGEVVDNISAINDTGNWIGPRR